MSLDVQSLIALCLRFPGSWPDNPWDHEYPVIKVGPGERGRIFAFLGGDTVGLKLGDGREEADEWLRRFPDDATVMPYLGRSGWNTLRFGGQLPDDEVLAAIEESYDRVVDKLPRKLRPTTD